MTREELKLITRCGQVLGEIVHQHDSGDVALDGFLHGQTMEVCNDIRALLKAQIDKVTLKQTEIEGHLSQMDKALPRPSGEQLGLFDKAKSSGEKLPPVKTFEPFTQPQPGKEPETANGIKLGIKPISEEDIKLAIISEAAKGSGRTKIVNFVVSKCGFPKGEVETIFDKLLRQEVLIKDGKSFVHNVGNTDPSLQAVEEKASTQVDEKVEASTQAQDADSLPSDGLESMVA